MPDLALNLVGLVDSSTTARYGVGMNEMSASHFREHMKAAVDEVTANHEVLRVTRRWDEDFVVVSASDWQAIVETLRLNQAQRLVNSILEAASGPLEQGGELEDLKR